VSIRLNRWVTILWHTVRMDEDQLDLPPLPITPRLTSKAVSGNGVGPYRIRFFSDRLCEVTLETPLDPRLPAEYETVEAARSVACGIGKQMGAKSLVIEDNNGNEIERWRGGWGGFWRGL
jgi:hypothetical protein